MTRPRLSVYGLLFGLCGMLVATAPLRSAPVIGIESKNIRVEFDALMHSRIVAKFDGKATPAGDFGPSEFLTAAGSPIADFKLSGHKLENVRDTLGHGRRLAITGSSGGLQKTVVVTVYDEIPRMAFFHVRYLNQSDQPLRVTDGRTTTIPSAPRVRRNPPSGPTKAARTVIVPTGCCP